MIAHIDADAFFASVLQRKYPKLRGKPLLALGMGGGCVIAASYEAKACGVKTGMRLSEAKTLVPEAIAHPSDFKEACMASRELEAILKDMCPTVEKMSVDEWFVDLRSIPGGIPARLMQWAKETQLIMRRKTHLSVSVGIGPTKVLAKMASEYRKPAGITVLGLNPTMEELSTEEFLRDRPVAAIPGIGWKRGIRAIAEEWKSAWDFAKADEMTVETCFGKSGTDLRRELNGTIVSAVREDERPPQSISRCRSFRATGDERFAYAHLFDHLAYCIIKLRRWNLCCLAVQVWVRDGTFASHGRIARLPKPANTEEALLPYVASCFRSLSDAHGRWTQIGLGLHELSSFGGTQYSLFEAPEKTMKIESIQRAMDALHERFGRGTLMRGSALVEGKKGPKNEIYAINDQ